MINDKSDQIWSKLTQEETAQALAEVWTSLSLVVRINNAFVEQMEKENDLSAADSCRFEQWTRALAKAQEPAMRAMAILGSPAGASSIQ